MDFIDMLVNASDEKLTGYFYAKRPQSADDGKISFQYKQLDPNSRVFDKFLGKIRADSARYAISTNDDCGFNIGGYIVTQNGEFWEITEVVTNEEEKTTKNALHWFKKVSNAETSVRMIKINDLYAVENAYSTDCKVIIALFVNGVEKTITRAYTSKGKVSTSGTNECTLTIEKGESANVTIYYGGGSYVVPVKKYNTQRQENYMEISI